MKSIGLAGFTPHYPKNPEVLGLKLHGQDDVEAVVVFLGGWACQQDVAP